MCFPIEASVSYPFQRFELAGIWQYGDFSPLSSITFLPDAVKNAVKVLGDEEVCSTSACLYQKPCDLEPMCLCAGRIRYCSALHSTLPAVWSSRFLLRWSSLFLSWDLLSCLLLWLALLGRK